MLSNLESKLLKRADQLAVDPSNLKPNLGEGMAGGVPSALGIMSQPASKPISDYTNKQVAHADGARFSPGPSTLEHIQHRGGELLDSAKAQGGSMFDSAKAQGGAMFDSAKAYLGDNPTLAYGAGGALAGAGVGALIQALRGKSILKGLLAGGLVGGGLGAGGKYLMDNHQNIRDTLQHHFGTPETSSIETVNKAKDYGKNLSPLTGIRAQNAGHPIEMETLQAHEDQIRREQLKALQAAAGRFNLNSSTTR